MLITDLCLKSEVVLDLNLLQKCLFSQVNGQISPVETSVKVPSDSPLFQRISVKKPEKVIQVVCSGEFGPPPCMLQLKTEGRTNEFEETIKDHSELQKQSDFELSDPSGTMLSSTVVTVLAPHWNGRLRWSKRFDGTGNSEAQDVTNTAEQHLHGTVDMSLTNGPQAQLNVPFLGTQQNTVGFSSKSIPPGLGYESKRNINQTASLDLNSKSLDNRKRDAGSLSPAALTVSCMSSLSLDPNEQRRNPQTGLQKELPSLSSKPTTGSLLLSLRRCNSNGRNTIGAPTSASDQHGLQESKPHLSSPSISYRTSDAGPVFSPSSSGTVLETQSFSVPSTNKDAPFSQQPQKEISCSSHRHSPLDSSPLLKTRSVPGRTTLTSTPWWKQVTQEGTSPLILNDTANMNGKPNTPIVPPCNDKIDFASLSLTDSKRLNCQIPNNRGINNITESVHKGRTNLVIKTQEGTHNITQRNAENSSDQESDKFVKQHYDTNLKREKQKPHHLPGVFSSSKISRATPQTMSHPKDLTKHNASSSSFTAKVTEFPPSLLKGSDTPTESKSKYNYNHCSSKSNNTPTSSNNKEPQSFTKTSSFSITGNNNRHVVTPKAALGSPLNTKTSSSFASDTDAAQTTNDVSSFSSSSYQTQKFTKATNNTPLGFERSYVSLPKTFHPKTVSNLFPTTSAFPKTNYSPVATSSTYSSSTSASHPTTTAVPCPSLPTSLVVPTLASSPTTITSFLLTPPATPITTNPNYSDASSPKKKKTFSGSQERDAKKQHPNGEAKKVRRVTWEDSVDKQHSEPVRAEIPNQCQIPSPSRSPLSIKAPSIYSFLRSSSPNTNTTPLCFPTPKTSIIQVAKAGKYRSLSSDSADLASRKQERCEQTCSDCMISDQRRQDLPRQERTLSVESGRVHCNSSAPLSLPPDLSSGYKVRYSSPPYSTLMSSRSTQGETIASKSITPRSLLFQQSSQSNYNPRHSLHTETVKVMTLPMSPVSLQEPISLPFQNKTESSKCRDSQTDQLNNNQSKNKSQDFQNDQISLVNNRVHISSQSLQGDKAHGTPSTFVTETLVYSIKAKADIATGAPTNTTLKPLQHTTNIPVCVETKLGHQSHTMQSKEATGHSIEGSLGSSSAESQHTDDESSKRRMKEGLMGKSRFFSVEINNEQSPKRCRFALKKSVSTPSASLSRSDSDTVNKTNNKMDQVLHKLKQTFSTKRSDDDMLFPWKRKRASETPSVGGSSDISNVSDITVEGTRTSEKQGQEKGMVLEGNEMETEVMKRWSQNRYTLTTPSVSGKTMDRDKFYNWSEKSSTDSDKDEQNSSGECISKNQTHLTHSPTTHHFDFYKDNGHDYKPTNQFLSYGNLIPGRISNPSAIYSTSLGKPISSPRSPFSPFSSLSPLSSFPSPDMTDDSVFYSPKLHRRRESSSPCEPGEGFSLGSSRRSRASTGPPSASVGHSNECIESFYADLKYGIEPGRSFSVSSVLSNRPSRPGRISTASRFMSVGDLSESTLTCAGNSTKDFDHWSIVPDQTTQCNYLPSKAIQIYFPNDPGKLRSRSLPRSLTRRLANWSSPANVTSSKLTHLLSPNMNSCHFAWDTEGPPTPPPTPPLSPVTKRMSRPTSLSSPTFPSSSGVSQQLESQSSRCRLPSRTHVSSLSAFEESADSSSDTTTDDEYYLETGECDAKETEL